MKRYVPVILLAGYLVGSSHMLAAESAITIAVRPAITVARGTAQLKIFIERDDRNRGLTWEVDGPSYYRSSQQELDGATAPRSWMFVVKDLPEGEYQIRVTVNRDDDSHAMAVSTIRVLPGMP